MNLYNSRKPLYQWIFEILIYLGVFGFAVSVVPSVATSIPVDQARAKGMYKAIIPPRFYPDIIMNLNVVIFCDPEISCNSKHIKFNLIHISIVTLTIIISAKLAIWMLQKKMKLKNESEKTKKMHKNFNNRSMFQVLIQFLFSTIPFTIVNCLLYFNIIIPQVSYFADVMAELMPLACVFTLFVFYEPYQQFLFVKIGVRHDTCNILSTTGALEKGVKLQPKFHTVH
ncbi:hypothetical protein CRE_15950 [Caenorhabditis remanei]|uniref:Uncharacterized protein n=1 Tax=Caenorhabditis remanei TaxID=31234 RepID=E3MBR3_CAERE|nr:hypothetical protein CRE_15950 [Caenorhabditis remanei]